jgi:hypothetical protein
MSIITGVKDYKSVLKPIITEINDKYTKNHALAQKTCELMFITFPTDKPFYFSVEAIKNPTVFPQRGLINF